MARITASDGPQEGDLVVAPPCAVNAEQVAAATVSQAPVSYTHLTLPTKVTV